MAQKKKTKPARSQCPLTTSSRMRLAAHKTTARIKDHLPAGLSQPALRALASVGVSSLGDLTKFKVKEISDLHGMGPKGIRIMQESLKREGLSFAR